MARPQKIGLDYFPMDCHLDKNLKAIIRKFGAEGFGVVIGLYQHIYSEGYWMKWCSETAEDFALEISVEEDVLSSVLDFCIKREIFNSSIYKTEKVLTSRGIQKRYLNAIERRKCQQLPLYNLINVDINAVNVDNNPVNVDISTQSKVKKRKEKKSKEYIPTWLCSETWDDFKELRKKLKKPMTERAEKGIIKKLEDFGIDCHIQVLEQSIESGWTTVYNLKDSNTVQKSNKRQLKHMDGHMVNIFIIKEDVQKYMPMGSVVDDPSMIQMNGQFYYNPFHQQA